MNIYIQIYAEFVCAMKASQQEGRLLVSLRLILLCSTPKICGVFKNKLLPCSNGR